MSLEEMEVLTVQTGTYPATKLRAIEDARTAQKAIIESCKKSSQSIPPYRLLELIGKGSFGRVYKAKSLAKDHAVAVKVIDIGQGDALNPRLADTYSDTLKEINALRTLRDSNAKNINHVIEAIAVGSSIWMVTEYCAGGSVSTLMRPTCSAGLDEKLIVPILREVADALHWVHEQGIIHRDIKGANVFVTEQGDVQLGDFGVAGVVKTRFDKRTTVIGTPNWMAPELFDQTASYGIEIDIWAFGAMAYELATGQPPNVAVGMDLSRLGKRLKEQCPSLEGDQYTDELKDLVALCLQRHARKRPKIEQVQEHSYLRDTEQRFPTSSLVALVQAFKAWEEQGGDRRSLFHPGGASGVEEASAESEVEDWIFGTADAMDWAADDQTTHHGQSTSGHEPEPNGPLSQDGAAHSTLKPRRRPPASMPKLKAPLEKVFDRNTMSSYDDNSKLFYCRYQPMLASDTLSNVPPTVSDSRESLIDLDVSFDGIGFSNSSDLPALRVNSSENRDDEPADNRGCNLNRRTQDWTFPFAEQSDTASETHHGNNRSSVTSLIDLDASTSTTSVEGTRPSTSGSDTSIRTSLSSIINSPFELERACLSSPLGRTDKFEEDTNNLDPIGMLPPMPDGPAVTVLQGQATRQYVKSELRRIVASLGDHLDDAGNKLACLQPQQRTSQPSDN